MANSYAALLSGDYWSGIEVTRKPTIVAYSFPTTAAPPGYIATLDDPNLTPQAIASYQGFSGDEQAMARTALAEWADASGLVFIEVAAGQGDINFQKMDFTGTGYQGAGGIGYYPFGDWQGASFPYFTSDLNVSGDVIMNEAVPIAYTTLLHEIGHAIGMKHPTQPITDPLTDPDTVHPVWATDDPTLTVMTELAGGPDHLTALDQAAARAVYGGPAFDPRYTWNADTQMLTQIGYAKDDAIRGSSVADVINGTAGDDRLYGLNGDDRLIGGAGNDVLDGGPGADRMNGNAGDDTYYVEHALDRISERAGEGNDTVIATVSFRLPNEVEDLTLWGSAAVSGAGNAGANHIYGNSGGDTLSGLGGADVLVGGTGSDGIVGGDGDDALFGGDGADRINGGSGADYMVGGAGADRFIFATMADFATGSSLDYIADFSTAEHDRIDLRQIDPSTVAGDQAFTFIGSAAFTTDATFQVRYQASGSDLLVQIDVNHDRIADASFLVHGVTQLTTADLLT